MAGVGFDFSDSIFQNENKTSEVIGLDHGNESSKYSRTDMKGTDGIGSNKQSGKHQGHVVRNQSRNDRHSSRHLELDNEAGSSEHSSEISGSFRDFRRHIELDLETGSSNQSDTRSEVINGDAGIESNRFEINFEVPSDSSKQSGVVQGEKVRKQMKTRPDPTPEENAIQSLPDKHHVSSKNSNKLEEEDRTDELTVMESPPVQVMDRVGELESFKLPAAVFERSKSTAPVDWSIPSTESLFSIRLDNNNLSSDHIGSFTGDPFMSGEFVELSPLPPVPAEDIDKKVVEWDKSEETSVSDDAVKNEIGPSVEEPSVKKPSRPMISWNSATIAHPSVDRVPTAHSISFSEINKKKKKKCGCRWPSCHCSNCWLAVCYSWKCTIGKCCSLFSSCLWYWCCGCNCCRRCCNSRTL